MPSPVVIADDQPVVAAGVKAVLKKHRYDIVACVNDTDTLLETVAEVACEVIILDPFMPEGRHPDSIGLIRELRALRPEAGIVVMSRLADLPALRQMLDEGVAALFDKRSHLGGIPLAVHAASIGRTFTSPSVRRAFRELDRLEGASGSRRDALSPRERDVLRAYAQGLKLVEVGALMSRSIKTISRQKRSAMIKLGLRNDAQLYHYLSSTQEGVAGGLIQRADEPPEEDDAYVATRARTAASVAAAAARKRGAARRRR